MEGTNRYPRAKPKALGTLHVSYLLNDVRPLRARLDAADIEVTDYGAVSTLFGAGEAIAFGSPAGMRIEAHQRD